MKLFKDSWAYIYKNWWYLLLFALPVGLLGGICYKPFKSIAFIRNFVGLKVDSFADIFNIMFNFSFKGVIFFILGFLALCVCASVVLGFIENHMRSGKKDYKEVLKFFNNNFLIVVINLIVFVLLLFVIKFILSALLFMFFVLFTGLNNTPNVGTIILTSLLVAGVQVLVVQIFSIFMINVPNMMINGFSFKNALYNSIKFVNKTNFKMLVAGILPFVVILLLTILTNSFWLVNFLLVVILFVYYSALSMVAYFNVSDTTRYDNRKYYINY